VSPTLVMTADGISELIPATLFRFGNAPMGKNPEITEPATAMFVIPRAPSCCDIAAGSACATTSIDTRSFTTV
jgi:hypothetical protein